MHPTLFTTALTLAFLAFAPVCLHATPAENHTSDAGNIAPAPATTAFIKGTPPTKLFRIAHRKLSAPELITLTSLQGILAKDSAENIYIDDGSAGYHYWLKILHDTHGTKVVNAKSFHALLEHFSKTPTGYLLCRADDQRSLAIAATLAGPLRAVMIDESLQPLATELGWKQLHDTRNKNYDWLDLTLAQTPATTSSGIIISQPPGQIWQARDYAILANAQVVPAPASGKGNTPDESDKRLTKLATRLSATQSHVILGWGDGENEDELTFISRASRLSLPIIPGDHVRNLSVISSLPSPANGLKQNRPASAAVAPKNQNRHTVTFVLTDGDNMSWLLFDCPVNERWFASPARGQVPLGWGIAPAMAELTPGVMQWYYTAAKAAEIPNPNTQIPKASGAKAPQIQNLSDEFIAGPSGNGYFYPSLMPRDSLAAHCTELNRLMGLSDLRLVQIIDEGAFDRTDLWSAYLSQLNIDGLIYFDYAPYDKYHGRITWAAGKPVVSAAMQFWGSGNHASTPKKPARNSADAIVASLNKASRDPYSENGYSLVVVHVWTHSVADVAALAARLDSEAVEVVAPGEFFRRIQTNLSKKIPATSPSNVTQ